jgi:hypothetical protein
VKKIKKLNGYSGCGLFLYKDHNSYFVRKISSKKTYNKRLFNQYNKQLFWHNNSNTVKTPQIINSGYIGDLFFFDMEYILGSTLSSLIDRDNIEVSEVTNFISKHYQNQFENKKISNKIEILFYQKLVNLKKEVSVTSNYKSFKYAFEMLKSNHWLPKHKTNVHGDMTFENIIKCQRSGDIYLIDYLDDFSNSLYTDLSKIFQDLIGGWSFVDKKNPSQSILNANSAVKLSLIKTKLTKEISLIEGNRDWLEKVLYGLILSYLRIIPYTKNHNMLSYIDSKLTEIISIIEIGDFT